MPCAVPGSLSRCGVASDGFRPRPLPVDLAQLVAEAQGELGEEFAELLDLIDGENLGDVTSAMERALGAKSKAGAEPSEGASETTTEDPEGNAPPATG